MKRIFIIIVLLISALLSGACESSTDEELIPVTFMLDWVPNTNHTGIFVAQAKDYFKEVGLEVKIIQPGEVYPEAAVASGATDFGISFQEYVTLSRAKEVPIVSVAAVLQHNTSGFASAANLNVTSPADFQGLRYGSFGTPFEAPTLEVLMKCMGGDFNQLEIVNTGWSDPLALISERQIDMAWIFYGWQGIQAQQQGIDLNIVMMKDHLDCIPDYYTPVVIASEDIIDNKPEVVKALLEALTRGYNFAIQNPGEAADLLLAAVPELDIELVRASQSWLSEYYKADASRWGEQKESVWQDYTDWMVEHNILPDSISVSNAFTNEFLP
jgi:ABC-type nitrate/sulfonate/bicarbonate transport system substrate-binding protein